MESAAISASLSVMAHRGPDDSGLFKDGNVFLGMRRLAIIDLNGGRQPIFNEDRTISVVLNGEIYNYREIALELKQNGHRFTTNSDTEVLVHLYEDLGEKMLEHLRGMFAFSIWDKNGRKLFVARDRFGKKPLYYAYPKAGGILFASELKALKVLAKEAGDTWAIDPEAIYDYLSLSVVPQPKTVFKNVCALPPASYLIYDGRKSQIRTYWSLNSNGGRARLSGTYESLLEQTRELMAESVRLRLRSDVPLGIFLSSGIDSSIIAYEAAKMGVERLTTFSVAVEDSILDESAIAARTSKNLGMRNTILPLKINPLETLLFLVSHYDQPFSDSSAIPSYAISKLACQHVKVVLNGDGGDELFAGYRRYVAAFRSDSYRWIPKTAFRAVVNLLACIGAKRRSSLGFYVRFARGMAEATGGRYIVWTTDMLLERDKILMWKGQKVRPTEDWIQSLPDIPDTGLSAQLSMDRRINLLSALLVKMDMATMAASIEARSPFMDHVLAEFSAKIPEEFLIRHGRTKSVLRDAYRGRLSDEIIFGSKKGFEVPLHLWLTNHLRPLLYDTVGSVDARVLSFLDAKFIDNLLARRVMRDRNWSFVVYAVLVLELWLREIERESLAVSR